MFNIICELPETVARSLVPRMRVVRGSGKAVNYLTPPRILIALVTAWLRRGRWFDEQVILLLMKSKIIIIANVLHVYVYGSSLMFLFLFKARSYFHMITN